jgi:D-alanyl-D-alanine carboxypeptidase
MKKILLIITLLFIFIPKVNASRDSANEYILMDMTTGRVLEGKNYNKPMLIASTTKILTALLAIESGKLDKEVTVDDTILKSYGSGIYIEVGEKLTLRELLYGLMLRSGNDAALMISKYVGGSVEDFVKMMNQKAQAIGMNNSTFINPSGLDNDDSGNYSTAYDMALLTKYAMKYKDYREIVSTKSYTLKTNKKTYVWKNKNKLLNYDYITGGKTGYTEKAKRTLVSTASKNNIKLIVVTLKDSDDWNTHKTLYEEAFNTYTSYKLLNKNKFKVTNDKYYDGKLYIKNDVNIPVKEEELSHLSGTVKLKKLKKYKTGSKVGEYHIYLDKQLLYKENIYIKKNKKAKKKLFKNKELF